MPAISSKDFSFLPTSYTWAKLLFQLVSIGIFSFVLIFMTWGFSFFNVGTLVLCGGELVISLLAMQFILKPEMTKQLIFQNLIDRLLFLAILILLFFENGFTWVGFGACELDFLCDSLPSAMRPFVEVLFGYGIIWLLLIALTYSRFIAAKQSVIRSLFLSLCTSLAIAPSVFNAVLLVDRFVKHVEPFNHL